MTTFADLDIGARFRFADLPKEHRRAETTFRKVDARSYRDEHRHRTNPAITPERPVVLVLAEQISLFQ